MSLDNLGKVGEFFGGAARYKAISKGLRTFRYCYLVLNNLNVIVPQRLDFS